MKRSRLNRNLKFLSGLVGYFLSLKKPFFFDVIYSIPEFTRKVFVLSVKLSPLKCKIGDSWIGDLS